MSYNSSGDKLMQLRKKHGIKQYELAGEHISRSYIGMVEQNRRKITKRKAEEITKNFNKILKAKNIEIKLEDFFVESEEELYGKAEQIIKIIKTKEYSETFFDEMKELESEIVQNTTQNKALIYIEIGKRFFEEKNYTLLVLYFEKALEYFISNKQVKEIGEIVNKLSVSYLQIEQYEELNYLYYCIRTFLEKIKVETRNDLLLNFAISFEKLGDFKESLKLLDMIQITTNSFDKKYEVFNLMAENYKKLGRLNEAEFYYEKILERAEGIYLVEATLNNLSLNKEKTTPKRELKKTYSKIQSTLNGINDQKLSEKNLINIAKLALHLGEEADAVSFSEAAFANTLDLETIEEILGIKSKMKLDFNISINDIEEKVLEVSSSDSLKSLVFLSKFYLENDMLEANEKFINKVYSKLSK